MRFESYETERGRRQVGKGTEADMGTSSRMVPLCHIEVVPDLLRQAGVLPLCDDVAASDCATSRSHR